jgi:hypothetical protein
MECLFLFLFLFELICEPENNKGNRAGNLNGNTWQG